jgi:hypothetical protein
MLNLAMEEALSMDPVEKGVSQRRQIELLFGDLLGSFSERASGKSTDHPRTRYHLSTLTDCKLSLRQGCN